MQCFESGLLQWCIIYTHVSHTCTCTCCSADQGGQHSGVTLRCEGVECWMKLMRLCNNEKEEKVHIHICIWYARIPSHVKVLGNETINCHGICLHLKHHNRDEFKSHKTALLWQLFANLQRRITVMSFSWSWLAIQELHLRYIIGVIHTMGQNRCFTRGVMY